MICSGEEELLFPPLSNLEVVGNPTVEKFDGTPVAVFGIRVNINQKGRIIEEILSQRKQTAIAFAENVVKELKFDVKLVSNSDSTQARAGLDGMIVSMKGRDHEWFNSDVNLKNTLGDVLAAKENAVTAFVEQSLNENRADSEVTFYPSLSHEARVLAGLPLPLYVANPQKSSDNADHDASEQTWGPKLLLDAASRGKQEIVRALVKVKVDVNCQCSGQVHLPCKSAHSDRSHTVIGITP